MRGIRRIGILMLATAMAGAAFAQSVDNKGKEFVMGFLPNLGSLPSIEVHLTSEAATMVTVEYPVNAPVFTTTVPVNPGSITIVTLPSDASESWVVGAVDDNAVSAISTTDDEFVCYMVNRVTFSSDAAMALPVDALNVEYIVNTFQPSDIVVQDRSEFSVVAAFDNTTVTITPTNALQGGFPANVPFNIVLNRGDGFLGLGISNGAAGDLTGTRIVADRPVAVSNGNLCANIPPSTTACDHIFEVAHPIQTWGTLIPVDNLPNRPSGSPYRVVAAADGTTVMLDGAFFALLNKGDFVTTGLLAGPHLFTADHPIFVTQYMAGQDSPGAVLGDPAMGNMIPSEQYLTNYTFSTVGGAQFTENYVTVIAENGDVGSVLLDGLAIPGGSFVAIPGSGYSAARILIADGTHTTSSPNGHGITVEGFNSFDSYIYPGGALFQFINPEEMDPPICECTVSGTPQRADCVARDDSPSDTGIFFIALEAGSDNIMLEVEPFTPGDPVVGFKVTLIDTIQNGSGVVRLTDGDGNVTRCDVALEGAECFLVIGGTAGSSNWTVGGHVFETQVDEVRRHYPVLMEQIPLIPLPKNTFGIQAIGATGNNARGTGSAITRIRSYAVQIVMWNPGVFPENAEQFTCGMEISMWSDGQVTAREYGIADGMSFRLEVITNEEGDKFVRFPFEIEGL